MILVAGATGILGSEVCSQLVAKGHSVRGLVRATSDAAKLAALEAQGVELVRGDLKDPGSLDAAVAGCDVVVTTATSTRSRGDGDDIWSVDRDGNLNLVAAAEEAGVKQFVFTSFPPMADPFPLQTAKRAVEARLAEGSMPYTIMQPVNFMEVWLSAFVGFDVANASARIYGTGEAGNNWVSFFDVAAFIVGAVRNERAIGRTFAFGGPECVSQLGVVQLFEELTGKKFELEHMPREALLGMKSSTDDLMTQTAAGLMLNCACGDQLDMTEAIEILQPATRTPLRTFAERLVSTLN